MTTVVNSHTITDRAIFSLGIGGSRLLSFAGESATRPALLSRITVRRRHSGTPSFGLILGFDRILVFCHIAKYAESRSRNLAGRLTNIEAGLTSSRHWEIQADLLIVDELTHGERCVADLTALIGSDISTVSNHLAVLRNVGLVVDDRRGQQVFYRLGASCVANVFHCLEEIRAARGKVC